MICKFLFQITDYRTPYSGIQPKHMGSNALRKSTLKTKVKQAIEGRIIVGYDLKHDLKALGLDNRSAKWVDLVDFYEDSCKKKKGLKESLQSERFMIVELEI